VPPTFARVAHRGFAHRFPENTLAAVAGSIELGADWIELDIRRRRDGPLVMHHDFADTRGAALVSQALDLVEDSDVGVMFDIKQAGMAQDVVDLLERHAPTTPVICSGGGGTEPLRIKALRPQIRVGKTWPARHAHGWPGIAPFVNLERRRALPRHVTDIVAGYDVFVCYHRVLSREAVTLCHAHDTQVYAWTVDSPDRIAVLAEWGVDGVISDDPVAVGLG
jgi:glycerophosphoryl diester phosphodiesterase